MDDAQSKTSDRKYRTTIVVATDQDPSDWSLESFYWAIENGEADEVQRSVTPTE